MQELEAETMEKHCLLPCFPWLTQLSFLYSPGPPAQGWHHLHRTVPTHINQQSKQCPTGQSVGAIPQLGLPLPRDTKAYVKLTETNHPSTSPPTLVYIGTY